MDMPVNHTGWASRTQIEHPEYFVRKEDGEFESPGAWGVVWADLCKLDYSKKEVSELMAEVFLFWCKRGVDGFRCDAGYMVYAPYDAPPEDRICVVTIVEACNTWEWWAPYATNIIIQGIFAEQTYEEAVKELGFQYLMKDRTRRE